MRYEFAAQRRTRDHPPRVVTWCVAVAMITCVPGCAFVDKIAKVSNIPGLDEAQLKEGLKKTSSSTGQVGPLSPLRATPPLLDFGETPVASKSQKTVVIFSPFTFAVTVTHVTVNGGDFALSGQVPNGPILPPHGQLTLTVAFSPAARQTCSGLLLLEIDSAGGRFTRVPLKGQGI